MNSETYISNIKSLIQNPKNFNTSDNSKSELGCTLKAKLWNRLCRNAHKHVWLSTGVALWYLAIGKYVEAQQDGIVLILR